MIAVLTGDDSFELHEELERRIAGFFGVPERIDGTTIARHNIPDLLMGTSLFGDKRLVIIYDIAKNTEVMEMIPDWIDRVSDDITLILVDEKLDKRTLAYKALKNKAEIQEFIAWGDRDISRATDWVIQQAGARSVSLDKKLSRHIVEKVGVDKWKLSQVINVLALVEPPITADVVDNTIVATPAENVFELFEAALYGKGNRVREIIRTLELQGEAYAIFALITSQVVQLLALSRASSQDSPEKDLAIHPFVASKLRQHARRLGSSHIERIAQEVASTDALLKRSSADPWVLIERLLLGIATQ